MFKFKEYRFRYFNIRLILFVLSLAVIGILFVKSATINSGTDTYNKQIFGVALGVACMFLVSLIDYHWILQLYWPIYAVNIAMLLATKFMGQSGGGAQRWLNLPVIGQIQPSEFSKIMLILFFAMFFYKHREKISSVRIVILSLILFGIPAYMIFDQPNLSTTLVTVVIFLVMLYVAKISYKWIGGVFAVLVPAGIWFIYYIQQEGQKLLQPYQVNRIMSWINPSKYPADNTQQQMNSIMAIGSGQLHGKGLANTTLASVKNGNFLSEEDTDFIFAVIGEEAGFVGSVIIISLLALLTAECIYMAARARDMTGRLICSGMAALIAFQSFVNIGVATGLVPNTGLPLPFISAGLSSLLSIFIGMGLVLNVGLQRKYDNRGGF
ncbi:FtsW/RodA/SpoVE family cell cycle protein [Lacrimispora sp. NSJ-141]|uniref:FtsW/RodA/SpoVE family cell cycle protein n=1 Tax=Lientehia hominis TaxID=2897778 RepID=A0AAP2W7I1_9FIRM|nr:FtsW/RodA/SpoVE family cell cycle protein [Lientehia hominis]MCD2491051.1 FtsW/RodA/SpoVE family cell cycle protein [Lientehia hominis]